VDFAESRWFGASLDDNYTVASTCRMHGQGSTLSLNLTLSVGASRLAMDLVSTAVRSVG